MTSFLYAIRRTNVLGVGHHGTVVPVLNRGSLKSVYSGVKYYAVCTQNCTSWKDDVGRLALLCSWKHGFCTKALPRRFGMTSVKCRATNTDSAAYDKTVSFEKLGLTDDLLQAVKEKNLTSPTEIQRDAIPNILNDRRSDFMIASHTGSGKTLAYLLPIVQILKEGELLDGPPMKPKRPRALVLGPTRELTEQIFSVVKSVSHCAKFRSTLVTGGGDMRAQRIALESRPTDIVIGTPGRVAQHAARGHLHYGDVEFVVLDEADTMLDRGFGPEVVEILKAVRSKSNPARSILVSATLTRQVQRLIDETFPSIRKLETSSLHRGVAGARHSFIPLLSGQDKLDVLLQISDGIISQGKRGLVFCNTLDSCRSVDHQLKENDIPTVCYHGDVPLDGRREAIRIFSSSDSLTPPLLIATDLAARGLDIPGRVDHVINFDFPLNPVDYLHRTGRTARAGASGKITSLVAKGDRVLATRIEEALRSGLPLDSLSADKSVLPPHMRPKPETLKRRAEKAKAEKHEKRKGRGTRTFGKDSKPKSFVSGQRKGGKLKLGRRSK